jgi:hypothetical protein
VHQLYQDSEAREIDGMRSFMLHWLSAPDWSYILLPPGLPSWLGFLLIQRRGVRRTFLTQLLGKELFMTVFCTLFHPVGILPARRTWFVDGYQASLKSAFG